MPWLLTVEFHFFIVSESRQSHRKRRIVTVVENERHLLNERPSL